MTYDFVSTSTYIDAIFHNIIPNAEAHSRHVNNIFVAFYITWRLNANEHNEPTGQSGRLVGEVPNWYHV